MNGGGGGVPDCLDVNMFGMDKNAWKISKKVEYFEWVLGRLHRGDCE
jgi:hypothetical protein